MSTAVNKDDYPPGTRVSFTDEDDTDVTLTGMVVKPGEESAAFMVEAYMHVKRDDGQRGGGSNDEWLVPWNDFADLKVQIIKPWGNFPKSADFPSAHIAGLSPESIRREDWKFIMGVVE